MIKKKNTKREREEHQTEVKCTWYYIYVDFFFIRLLFFLRRVYIAIHGDKQMFS